MLQKTRLFNTSAFYKGTRSTTGNIGRDSYEFVISEILLRHDYIFRIYQLYCKGKTIIKIVHTFKCIKNR